jgi:hypothetical protein
MFLSHLYRGYYFDEYYIVYSDINLQLLTIKKGYRSEKPCLVTDKKTVEKTQRWNKLSFFLVLLFLFVFLVCKYVLMSCDTLAFGPRVGCHFVVDVVVKLWRATWGPQAKVFQRLKKSLLILLTR